MSALAKESLLQQHAVVPCKKEELNYVEPNKISVLRVTIKDVPKVHKLESRSHAYPWSQTIISDCINSKYECWMMKRADKVVAYAIMMMGIDESHLLNLCVDSDFRKQGYASHMIGFLSNISIVNNAKRMLLEVRESNYKALKLYHKLGFREVGRRIHYYPTATDREDALVLAKLL